MPARKKGQKKPAQPAAISADLKDQLDVAIAVIATVVDALTLESNCEPAAVALLECGLNPLREIREELERAN